MSKSVLVTGFGPFLDVPNNASQWLAENCGASFRILEVSYTAVDDFLSSGICDPFLTILHVGVASGANQMRWESVARNWCSDTPDVQGVSFGPMQIDPSLQDKLAATFHAGNWIEQNQAIVGHSIDAGGYLCNYLLYRSLQAFPTKNIGFLHVAPFENLNRELQLQSIQRLIVSIAEPE